MSFVLLSRCLSFVGGNERDTAGTEVPFDMELPFRAANGRRVTTFVANETVLPGYMILGKVFVWL